jgi:hypothetical protein
VVQWEGQWGLVGPWEGPWDLEDQWEGRWDLVDPCIMADRWDPVDQWDLEALWGQGVWTQEWTQE